MFWETNKMLRDLALCLSILILEDSVKLIFLRGMWNWLMFLVRNRTKNLQRLLLFVNLFSVYLVIRPIYEIQNIHQVCHIVNSLSVWWWTNWVWAELGTETDTVGRKGSHDSAKEVLEAITPICIQGFWKRLCLCASRQVFRIGWIRDNGRDWKPFTYIWETSGRGSAGRYSSEQFGEVSPLLERKELWRSHSNLKGSKTFWCLWDMWKKQMTPLIWSRGIERHGLSHLKLD